MEIRHLFSRMNKLKVFILIACLVDISASERLLDSHPGELRDKLDIYSMARVRMFSFSDALFYLPDLISELEQMDAYELCERAPKFVELYNYEETVESPTGSVYLIKRDPIIAGCILISNNCVHRKTVACKYAEFDEILAKGLAEEFIIKRVNVVRNQQYRINKLEIDPKLGADLLKVANNDLCQQGSTFKNVEMYETDSIIKSTPAAVERSPLLKSPSSIAVGCIIPSEGCGKKHDKVYCKFRIAGDDGEEGDSEEMENNSKELTSALLIVPYLLNIFL